MGTSRTTRHITKVGAAVGPSATSIPLIPSDRLASLRSHSLQKFAYPDTGRLNNDHGPNNVQNKVSKKRKRGGFILPDASTTKHIAASDDTSDRGRRRPAKIKRYKTGELVSIEPPSNWEQMYDMIKEMRRANPIAPVDTIGCERLADAKATATDQRFQTLISLMLSSQTKDQVTAAAIRRMQHEIPGGLTVQSVIDVEADLLNQLIGKVGFHNVKTKNIKRVAEILRDEHYGEIPDTIQGLVALPGVGPKMAYLTMSAAWGRTEGIGVDVHVHRITNLWKWHATNTPEETRLTLESWLPKKYWHEINWLLVGLGQTICLPVGRRCSDCPLGARHLCPSAVHVRKLKKEAKIECKTEGDEEPSIKSIAHIQERHDRQIGVASLLDMEDVALTLNLKALQ